MSSDWRDPKRSLWLIALVIPLIPFAAVGLFSWTQMAVWLWLGPIIILGVVPLLDLITGLDPSSPPDEAIGTLEGQRYYRWVLYAFLPLQYAGLIVGFWFIARAGLSVPEQVGLAVTLGFIGGIGINTAHELGHKRESTERWLSKIALAQSGYGHFFIEHNRGHHVRVATPEDPASSRLGESFYAFWPRTVVGSLRSAWRLERARLARRSHHPLRWDNDVVNAWLMTVALWGAMLLWLGWSILPFLFLQAFVGITLLEAVNYLEHYGLLRQRVGQPGSERYERVDPTHSWNSNHITTNVLLYHLQRHSDHHAHPTRRYQALRDYPESPSLPAGYAGMILLALVPPLWRRVMDPRVADHYGGDVSLANSTRRVRRRLASTPAVHPRGTQDYQATSRHDADVDAAHAWRCPVCSYTYEEQHGDEREGLPAGTAWASVPDTWCCPDCGVREKVDFLPVVAKRAL